MRNLLLAAFLLLAGCASGPQDGDAPKDIIKAGVIESVTPIDLDASSNAGTTVGSVFGQAGGASSGGGRGAAVGSILGTVLGGTLGRQAGIATQPGLELWVRLVDEDKSTYVMQPGQPDEFRIGERVRVVRRNGETRVEKLAPAQPE